MKPITLIALLLLSCGPARAEWLLDGVLDDWPTDTFVFEDPAGDPHKPGHGPLPGRDLTSLHARVDGRTLMIGVGFSSIENADEEAGLLLLIDADRNPSTGHYREGLGCELIWDVGLREGEVFLEGFSGPLKGAKELREFLGILVAPTVTAPSIEIALPRGDHELFRDRGLYLVVHDERSDDRVPDDGSLTLIWPTEPEASIAPIPLERHADATLRLASYNVEHDGLFVTEDAARQDALRRVLSAIDADVWIFCEVWDHDAVQTRDRLGDLLDRDLSEWGAVRHDEGNVILSRFPVKDSWEVIDDVASDDSRDRFRLTAARLATPGRDALVVANHWRCCDADSMRQIEAEGMVRFLRDAGTPGDRLDLPDDTPIVLAGDFNLVGLREPLDTLTDDDVPFALRAVDLRHVQRPWTHTWHVPGSSYGPGRLDWVFVNPARVETLRGYVLDTARMDDATLERYGLEPRDARVASDHFPLVVDLRW